MASLINLNKQAFESNPIQEFRRVAGGLPDAPRKYSGISSNDKNRLLWNFFSSEFVTDEMIDAKTVYSGKEKGATIRELIDNLNDGIGSNNIQSIEHVVPKSTYEEKLRRRLGVNKSNGASINPLNFLPSHRTINSKRGTRAFDFNGGIVQSETLAEVDGMSRSFQAGADDEGEWVVEPLLTRGDIARCVMYMEMMYGLQYVNEIEMRKLQEWMQEDEPSDYEEKFGLWIRKTQPFGMNIQNPFVSNPELATDEMFENLLNSYLGNTEDPVVIDSVVPNPAGLDVAGEEIVTLRNTSRNIVNLEGWTLGIKTQTRNVTYVLGGSLFGREIADFTFPDDNVLSNSRQTTITLRDDGNRVVSEFEYSSRDARPNRVLSRL